MMGSKTQETLVTPKGFRGCMTPLSNQIYQITTEHYSLKSQSGFETGRNIEKSNSAWWGNPCMPLYL